MTTIYASNKGDKKKGLWNTLDYICIQDILVIVIGDYNIIVVEIDKMGGRFSLVVRFLTFSPLSRR